MCVKLFFVCILVEFALCNVVNMNEYSDDTYNDNDDNDVHFQLADFDANMPQLWAERYPSTTFKPTTCELDEGERRCEEKCHGYFFLLHGECIYPGHNRLFCRCVFVRVNLKLKFIPFTINLICFYHTVSIQFK